MINTVVMFQIPKKKKLYSTSKVPESFKITVTTSVTKPCFTAQHQICRTKTKTTVYKTKTTACKTKTDFFGLRPVLS